MASPRSKSSRHSWPLAALQPAQPQPQPQPQPQLGAPTVVDERPSNARNGVSCHADTTQVIKRLKPGQPGTRGLQRRYGSALVCVRYREDLVTGKSRFTTVELVIDQRPRRHQPLVRVDIRYDDAETRRQAMLLGAEWDEAERTWRMPRRAAIQLGLLSNKRKAAK